jgi:hypothetical protein
MCNRLESKAFKGDQPHLAKIFFFSHQGRPALTLNQQNSFFNKAPFSILKIFVDYDTFSLRFLTLILLDGVPQTH